ncbi:CPBP family intramembrane metalloprotease [Brevibacillus laterosporus]|nr:CPBP family intramembrane metalloprotease [Brevibacillus laterosporus]
MFIGSLRALAYRCLSPCLFLYWHLCSLWQRNQLKCYVRRVLPMSKAPSQIPTNQIPNRIAGWVQPLTCLVLCIYIAALVVTGILTDDWISHPIYAVGVILPGILVLVWSRSYQPETSSLQILNEEVKVSLIWYVMILIIYSVILGNNDLRLLINEQTNWLTLVIVPLILIQSARRKKGGAFRELLRSVGLTRQGLGKTITLSAVTCLLLIPIIFYSLGEEQLAKVITVFQKPSQAVLFYPLSLVLAFVLPGFTEEVMFRGILQSRLSSFTRSEVKGLFLASLLFALYHVPYAYFLTSWATHGNLTWALSTVLTEQFITGFLMGLIWMRTKNLVGPMIVHAFIDSFIILASFVK